MRLTILIVILSAAMATAIGNDTDISGCYNYTESINDTLMINCQGLKVNPDILQQQVHSFLINEELITSLKSLEITNSPLTELPRSVCRLRNLHWLKLDNNRLRSLPSGCLTNMASLRRLSAIRNNITALQDGLFDGLKHLEYVWLRENQIADIGLGVFANDSNLDNLTFVDLSRNNLTTLEPWPAVLGLQRTTDKPIKVSVVHNRISRLSNRLQWHYDCLMPRTHFVIDFSHNQLTRLSDMIEDWNVSDEAFMCLLNFVGNHAATRIKLARNPFVCDCKDFRFYTYDYHFAHSDIFRGVYCYSPEEFYRMEIIRIQLIQFTCPIEDGCPDGCGCIYRPANSTIHVDCASQNFTELPLVLPAKPKSYAKYKLNFSSNYHIRRLDFRPYLLNTTILDISHSTVGEIPLEVWRILVNIKEVYLDNNQLMTLPREYSDIAVSCQSIHLERNPWDCSCCRDWMQDWFKNISDRLYNPSGILCQAPRRLKGTSIVKMYKWEFCVDPVERAVKVCVSAVLGSFALFLLLCFGAYCLRVSLHRRWPKFHPFDRDECRGEHMDYDVFLSYSPEDQDPHGARLMDLMQSKGYRVIRPNSDEAGDISSVVQRSKRTVCLLSQNFLRSQYCLWEFKAALEHYDKRQKRLVMLKMLDNPLELYARQGAEAAALRQYLRRRKCIEFNDQQWTDKLLYALPLHPVQEVDPEACDTEQNNEDVPLIAA